MGTSSSCAVQGIDVSVGTTGGKRWWAGIALNGKLYGLPCNAEHLLVLDPSCDEPVQLIDTKRIATGEGKWRSTVAVGGKLYGIPDRAEAMLVYDFVSRQVSGIDTRKLSRGPFKWQSAVVLAGKIYGIPHHADKLLVFDPKSSKDSKTRGYPSSKVESVTGVDTTHVAVGKSKWLAGVSLGGKVIGIPCNADALLVYDPLNNACSGVPISYHATGPFKWLCAVALQGILYALPCHADCVLVFDPSNNRVSHVDTSSISVGPGKWVSAVACHGKIYGIPDHAKAVLVFDPKSQEVSGIDISHLSDATSKWQSVAVLGSKIYAVPYNAHDILVIDTSACMASSVDVRSLGSGPGKWGFAAVVGQGFRIHAAVSIPFFEDTPTNQEETDVSKGDLEEVAPKAADTPRKPRIAEVDIVVATAEKETKTLLEFLQGLKHDNADVGSTGLDFVGAWLSEWIYFADPGKPFAVPMMKFPECKIVKPSLIERNDFVANASVSPDYTPFDATFNDRTTFIHHGAYHATRRDVLPLGLQCAMGLLRSTSFGFTDGIYSSEFQDIKPLKYAISWFQGKVSSFSMRILDYAAGGLAQKAQDILKRPDIEKHLLRPAARYVHLSQIRVLAKEWTQCES
ncbi:Lipase_3 domain-containing protein [Durusdinium trenchii]|uniref:Lipase_3 domain-containing protein n=1 Tax=Durusdinium trenchii TaxID=1381693 RepID=A0ABP0NLU8_9DINO